MLTYEESDFIEVPGVPGKFYCPGCNATPDDYNIPSHICPCATYGTGNGSLTADGVDDYLARPRRNPND